MKLKFLFIMMAVALFTAACSSDDNKEDDGDTTNLAEGVAGSYAGYTVADFKYTTIPMTTPGESVSIVANADGTCNISFESDTWGKFTISNASVSLSSTTYAIAGSGKTVMGMDAESQKEYDCTLEGTVSNDKKAVSFVFNVPLVMGGLEITFTLGDAPANMVIASVYDGNLDVSVMGASQGTFENKVTIKSQDDDKVEVTLAAFGEGAMAFEDMTIADVEVTAESDGSYKIAGTINTTSGTTNVTGGLEGTIVDGKANITFTMRPGAMPMDIVAVFTSEE